MKIIFKKSVFLRIAVFVGILILGFSILHKININDAYQLLSETPIWFIILFLLLSTLIQFFKAISFYLLLNEADILLSLRKVVRVFFASQLMTFLPGGEVGRVMLTKSEYKIKSENIASVVLTQVFVTFISAIIFVILGSLYFNVLRIPSLISFVLLIIVFSFVISEKLFKLVTKLPLKIPFLTKYKKSLLNIHTMVRTQLFLPNSVRINISFIKVMLSALGSHLIGGLLIYSISRVYGLNMNILNSVFAFSFSVLIQGLLSIIPGGLGFTEGGLIGLLVFFNNSFGKSLALTLAFRIATFLYPILLGLIVYLIFYRRGLKDPIYENRRVI